MNETKKHTVDVTTFICQELSKVLKTPQDLDAQTDMTTDISVDSVAIMDLTFVLEEEFDVSIPLNALADISKIGELAALVEKLQGER